MTGGLESAETSLLCQSGGVAAMLSLCRNSTEEQQYAGMQLLVVYFMVYIQNKVAPTPAQ